MTQAPHSSSRQTAIIIGAGPAGLTAAYELLERTGVKPIVLEATDMLGGISRTVNYKGNRIDIGGHRFFSKSDRVMDWWLNVLPLQRLTGKQTITYHRRTTTVGSDGEGPDPETEDRVMLLRSRRSRIYFSRRFFDYPISLSPDTLLELGLWRTVKIGLSYVRAALFPIKPERNLEEFFINRFGRELYATFFKSYTEKVWGVPCDEISAEWGAQRVKGLSITKAIVHFAKQIFGRARDIKQKQVETSLIEQFLYPKFGPGQMWEEIAKHVRSRGGEILMRHVVTRVFTDGANRVTGVRAKPLDGGEEIELRGDYLFSSMPVRHLVRALDVPVPPDVTRVAEGLAYRDFITVGLLLNRLRVTEADGTPIRDNWIYIQEPDVLVGRMQVFNNWSPYMVADRTKTWIGLEYFCYSTDPMWTWPDEQMSKLAIEELARIRLANPEDVLDSVVIRMPKTYPAYFGTYAEFGVIREFVERFENLFLVGRNGMHRYNNQDHSMLTAMVCVDNILAGRTDKTNIWDINTEEEYHEEK
ncbi:MAG TPA: NAD(P)/FAD-dependent oxidoreductase [Thermoanaerobaculia bacterium]|nr:NAD(P)/FAD-dependent oxidoreductase [Thermoanaerobaculia bacterium]